MKIEVYEHERLGLVIDPESDTKQRTVILIGKQIVKCNPRKAIIYLSDEQIHQESTVVESLKTYCENNKVVFVCPKDTYLKTLVEIYEYFFRNHLELNVIRDQITVCIAKDQKKEMADEFCKYMLDEYDIYVDKLLL